MDKREAGPNKLLANAAVSMGATIFYLASRILLTPFVLTYLTLAEFGLWSMCFVILSYASMGAFGVNNTYIRYTSKFRSEGRDIEISKLLSTGIFGMLIFCGIFFAVLLFFMPLILSSFGVKEEMAGISRIMILGTTIIFSLDLTLGGFRSVVEGLQEIALVKKIYTGAALVEVAAIVIFISQGAGVLGMLYAYIVRVLLDTGICIVVAKRFIPSLRISVRLISREQIRHLFVFGGKVQALGAIAIFLSAFDRMVISAVIGLSAAGMFEIGRKFPFTAKSVSGSAYAPFLPAAVKLEGNLIQDTPSSPRERFTRYYRIVMLAVCVALIPTGWSASIAHSMPWMPWMTASTAILSSIYFLRKLAHEAAGAERISNTESGRLYINGMRYTNLINTTLFAFLAAVAPLLITAWVGEGYEAAFWVTILLAAGYMAQQSTGPVTLILRGINRCGRELEYQLIQLVLFLIWIPVATMAFGLKGTAGAIALSGLISTIFLLWRSNHMFRVSTWNFLSQAIAPGAIPLATAALIHFLTLFFPFHDRLETAFHLLMFGLLYAAIILPMIWLLILTQEEKSHLSEILPFFKRGKQAC
jgi:O-antigen/teichoic acid export membrane protein